MSEILLLSYLIDAGARCTITGDIPSRVILARAPKEDGCKGKVMRGKPGKAWFAASTHKRKAEIMRFLIHSEGI